MTQVDLAQKLQIPRSTLGEYERGNTEPSISLLIKMANTFDVSVDDLIAGKIEHRELEITSKSNFKVLAISVDGANKNNIELVDTKAEAGYLESFANPEYIRDLPKLSFPNIPEGTYRGFEISGDSMLPVEPGSVVISKYIENLTEIKNDRTYIVISKNDGVVYKRVRLNKKTNQLTLISDNDVYLPYSIELGEVAEIWQYYAHISFSDSKATFNYLLEEKLSDIQRKVSEIREHLL